MEGKNTEITEKMRSEYNPDLRKNSSNFVIFRHPSGRHCTVCTWILNTNIMTLYTSMRG